MDTPSHPRVLTLRPIPWRGTIDDPSRPRTTPPLTTTRLWRGTRVVQRRAAWIALAGIAWLLGACAHVQPPPDAWHAWRRHRAEDIGGPKGWASLAGLHWLQPGRHSIGADARSDIRLPAQAAPDAVGTLTFAAGGVAFEPGPKGGSRVGGHPIPAGTAMDLAPDNPGPATFVESGRLTWWILARGDRRAVRVRDPDGPGRRGFHGIRVFPYDPALRVEARFVPFPSPETIPIQDVTGNVAMETAPGVLLFEVGGVAARLTPVEDREAKDWFINFRDGTSGRGTYPGGRFLHVPRAGADGRVTLDFNFAYNPPCAFTPFATCPVPPRINWLAVPLRAGERFDGHGPAGKP